MIEYINRKGEKHYLKAVPTKNGKERYYIVKDKNKFLPSELLTEVPNGFEFYEFPSDGKVALRKKIKTNISYEELKILENVMQRHKTVRDFIIDSEANGLIVVYVGHLHRKDWTMMTEEQFKQTQSYNDILRFEKTTKNLYKAQRFCHISRFYGWIIMETSENLEYLAEKYCYHIDKKSLLEFWIEGEEDW